MGNLFENGKVSVEKRTLEPYGYYLEILGRKHGLAKVFDDWLQIMVCSLSMGRKEELYFKTIKPYDRDELDLFAKAFASVIKQMTKNELIDPFGDYFQNNISRGHNSQYFTPEPICDLMVSMTLDAMTDNRKKVNDPTCGSGRLLLAAARQNRKLYFVGQDISYTCCMMTLVNMCLNSMNGEVQHIDTLNLKMYTHWAVIVDSMTNLPTIVELEPDKLNATPVKAEELEPDPVVGLIQPIKNMTPINFIRFTAKNTKTL